MKEDEQTIPSRALAEDVAKALGCRGAHKVGGEWAPCESHEALMTLIRRGAQGYRTWRTRKGLTPRRVILTKPADYPLHSSRRKPRMPRPKRGDWENLAERPIPGIDTLPSGGLVTSKTSPGFDILFFKSLRG